MNGIKVPFLGFDENEKTLEKCRYVIYPVGYEGTVSYETGASAGPAGLLTASAQVETFDLEMKWETPDGLFYTLPPSPIDKSGVETQLKIIRKTVSRYLNLDKLVITLGGEHSISIACMQAYINKFPEIDTVIFDAHADLRNQYQGSPFSHACTARRISELCPTVCVGIRSISAEEWAFAENSKRIRLLPATSENKKNIHSIRNELLNRLRETVYISIDLDVFDPSVIPGVGTPEPGGFSWQEMLFLLDGLIAHKKIAGFDIMELKPLPDNRISEFTAAKLLLKIISRLENPRARLS